MVVCALVSGVVIEIAPASRTKRSILLATLQAEHYRLLRPASSGRRRSQSGLTRPWLARGCAAPAPLVLAHLRSRLASAVQRKKAGVR